MNTTPSTAAAADSSDPSMEDILASIRRILNEDEAPSSADETSADDAVGSDVLVLDESMMVSNTEPPAKFADAELEPEPPAPMPEAEPPHREIEAVAEPQHSPAAPQIPPTSNLLAPEAAAAAASSVDNLVRTLVAGRATQVYSGGPTLEDLVRSELRPMLKQWLDINLPPVVERLVRTEIERVVGRAVP